MGKTLEPALRQLMKRGGNFDPQNGVEAVAAASKEAGLLWFEADCDKARSRSAVFRAIVKAVDYPQFFGADFDGLYDCLCDTLLDQKEGGFALLLNHLHSADPAIVTDGEMFLQVLNDAVEFARENNRIFIYGIHHAGKHPEATPGVVNAWSDEPA